MNSAKFRFLRFGIPSVFLAVAVASMLPVSVPAVVTATRPCVKITKQIACATQSTDCSSVPASSYKALVRGFKTDEQLPAFCYKFTITNLMATALSNVVVTDNTLDLSACGFPTTLNPYAAFTCYVLAAHDRPTTNTAQVVAYTVQGLRVRSVARAIAYVKPASIACTKYVSSPDDQDGVPNDNHVSFLNDGLIHSVTFSVTVTNTGQAPLTNVTISDPSLIGLGCVMPAPFALKVGASTNITLCTHEFRCGELPLLNQITVTADIDNRQGQCNYDQYGQLITVHSECDAVLECLPPAGGCRVTGGGQVTNFVQSACIPTPAPEKVTHGGQVGAPFSVATAFDPNSKCISGEWEHVRHIGTGLDGNFHASNFDSLMCACLGCPENPGSPGIVGELCNPGDRICGPEPRRAPANKICFSGVGDYAVTGGNKTPQIAIFRVDIEDRGEGPTNPPDRYRIRIWLLNSTDADCGRPFTADSPEGLALRLAVGCANPLTEDVSPNAGPPDIDDSGDLIKGNHQIHPATGAVCK